MKKRPKRIVTSLAIVIVLIVGALAMMSVFSRKPTNLGVTNGRLADCPSSPNCVSTQADDAEHRMQPVSFTGSADEAMQELHTRHVGLGVSLVFVLLVLVLLGMKIREVDRDQNS